MFFSPLFHHHVKIVEKSILYSKTNGSGLTENLGNDLGNGASSQIHKENYGLRKTMSENGLQENLGNVLGNERGEYYLWLY